MATMNYLRTKMSSKDRAWNQIFNQMDIHSHNFTVGPFNLSAKDIKTVCSKFSVTSEREPRLICSQTQRKDRPQIFIDKGLIVLPVKNGYYTIVKTTEKCDGYIDIPKITSPPIEYNSKLDFELLSSAIGNSEMQHVDNAHISGIIEHFCNVGPLFQTIRGRKYTPDLCFNVGSYPIEIKGVQTEVDAGYESPTSIVLIEAKNDKISDILIRQIYYPYRQWLHHTGKQTLSIVFEKQDDMFNFWLFEFTDPNDYMSIQLVKSERYILTDYPTIVAPNLNMLATIASFG